MGGHCRFVWKTACRGLYRNLENTKALLYWPFPKSAFSSTWPRKHLRSIIHFATVRGIFLVRFISVGLCNWRTFYTKQNNDSTSTRKILINDFKANDLLNSKPERKAIEIILDFPFSRSVDLIRNHKHLNSRGEKE